MTAFTKCLHIDRIIIVLQPIWDHHLDSVDLKPIKSILGIYKTLSPEVKGEGFLKKQKYMFRTHIL